MSVCLCLVVGLCTTGGGGGKVATYRAAFESLYLVRCERAVTAVIQLPILFKVNTTKKNELNFLIKVVDRPPRITAGTASKHSMPLTKKNILKKRVGGFLFFFFRSLIRNCVRLERKHSQSTSKPIGKLIGMGRNEARPPARLKLSIFERMKDREAKRSFEFELFWLPVSAETRVSFHYSNGLINIVWIYQVEGNVRFVFDCIWLCFGESYESCCNRATR